MSSPRLQKLLCVLGAATCAASPVWCTPQLAAGDRASSADKAGVLSEISEAAQDAKAWIELRPRYEFVRIDGFDKDASAATLRTAFGFRTARWRGLMVGASAANTTVLGDQLYFDGLDGPVDRPQVDDPQSTELEQAFADFQDDSGFGLRAGRVVYTLQNGRLVGERPWRQSAQVFDGFVASATILGALDVEYAFFGAVNRSNETLALERRSTMATHVASITHRIGDDLDLSFYFVDADIDDDPTRSSATLGARLLLESDLTLWSTGRLSMDVARQTESAGNPNVYDASYAAASASLVVHGLEFTLGIESLGGGTAAIGDEFTTPLSSRSNFNGAAAIFETTPAEGLVDRYARVGFEIGQVQAAATWHGFVSERRGGALGSEIDVDLVWRPSPLLALSTTISEYRADGFGADAIDVAVWASITP